MQHYFLIVAVTWCAMLFILVASWILLLTGIDLGNWTIFIPVLGALGGVVFLSRTRWFNDRIRQPLAETLEEGDWVEVALHMQFFSMICGVLGLGLSIAAMTTIYPLGAKVLLQHVSTGASEWHRFTKYSPMAGLSGFLFGILLYSYLFADARKIKWLTWAIIGGGTCLFLIMGALFGPDHYYFVLRD